MRQLNGRLRRILQESDGSTDIPTSVTGASANGILNMPDIVRLEAQIAALGPQERELREQQATTLDELSSKIDFLTQKVESNTVSERLASARSRHSELQSLLTQKTLRCVEKEHEIFSNEQRIRELQEQQEEMKRISARVGDLEFQTVHAEKAKEKLKQKLKQETWNFNRTSRRLTTRSAHSTKVVD